MRNNEVMRFASDDWSERERAEGWREIVGRAVMGLEIDPVGPPFNAGVTLQMLPGLASAYGHSTPMQARHTAALIDSDDLVLSVMVEGIARFEQGGRSVEVRGGDAVLTSAGEVLRNAIVDSSWMKVFRLPRAALFDFVDDVDAALMRVMPAASEPLWLLCSYADGVRAMGASLRDETAALSARHMQELLALAIGTTRHGRPAARGRGLRAARLAMVRADIRRNAGQPGLSVGDVAHRHGLSARYVQMLFAETGTTFSEAVLEERLGRALALLGTPEALHRAISDIALDAGFGDLSYFHRAFKRRFGASPGEVRASRAVE